MTELTNRGRFTVAKFLKYVLQVTGHDGVRQVYIAGPMRSWPDHNQEAFERADTLLRKEGFKTFNPASEEHLPPGEEPGAYLRKDLPALAASHAMVLLPGWRTSEFAVLECHNALHIGMPVAELAFPQRQCEESDELLWMVGYKPRLEC